MQAKRALNIGMVDVDLLDNGTRHPNLAQMKMSAFCKTRGHKVSLLFKKEQMDNILEYDVLLVSKVFTFSRLPKALVEVIPADKPDILRQLNRCVKNEIEHLENYFCEKPKVLIGGTGFFEDGGRDLHNEVEHTKPDYSLYKDYIDNAVKGGRRRQYYDDYENYSIGFTTRGCFRKCDFCVNKKYDRAFLHSHVTEFFDETRAGIYLWDDNFFAYGGWEEILDDLIATGKPFQFRQGLDIRLLTETRAKKLSRCRYHGDFIFAFDYIEDREIIESKLAMWKKYCRRTTKLYLLCAFDPENRKNGVTDFAELEKKDIENLFERIKVLMKFGCLPYIMRYEAYKNSNYKGIYTQVARWCNQPQFFKKKSFREFCVANQEYHSCNETNCSAYQTLVDFEFYNEDIASRYFDLKYEELNEYPQMGYGRPIKTPCQTCKKENVTWSLVQDGQQDDKQIASAYLSGQLDFSCLRIPDVICKVHQEKVAKTVSEALLRLSMDELVLIIDNIERTEELVVQTVPQFSCIHATTHDLLKTINEKKMSYEEIGIRIDSGTVKKRGARAKYGENHAKLGALMDLVFIDDDKNSKLKITTISPMGLHFLSLDEEIKVKLRDRLFLRIPIIQRLIKEAKDQEASLEGFLLYVTTSSETQGRRKTSVRKIVDELRKNSDGLLLERIVRILY